MLRDGHLNGSKNATAPTDAGWQRQWGDVGVGGVGHGRGERDRWCLIQRGWWWKFCWHMGRTATGAWPGWLGWGLLWVRRGRPGVMLQLLGVCHPLPRSRCSGVRFVLEGKERYEDYAGKRLDIVRPNNFKNIRGWNISMLACQHWSVLAGGHSTLYKKTGP